MLILVDNNTWLDPHQVCFVSETRGGFVTIGFKNKEQLSWQCPEPFKRVAAIAEKINESLGSTGGRL